MENLKIKVIGYEDEGLSDLYLYYLDNNENIVATLAINSQGDLVGNIFNPKYNNIIVSDINKLTGYNFGIEDEYYINNNENVWNNTKKFISDKNLEITYKTDLDLEYEESNRKIK